MSRETAATIPDVASLVASEVERQLRPLRAELETRLAELRARTVDDRATLVVFSNDLDKVLAAFVIAIGAAAAGLQTSMFFTFWGLSVLRRRGASGRGKRPLERLLGRLHAGRHGRARHLAPQLLRRRRPAAATDDEAAGRSRASRS